MALLGSRVPSPELSASLQRQRRRLLDIGSPPMMKEINHFDTSGGHAGAGVSTPRPDFAAYIDYATNTQAGNLFVSVVGQI
jgi:hypothetical protein